MSLYTGLDYLIKVEQICIIIVNIIRRLKIPVVREEYLVECFKRQKKLSCDAYKVEAVGEASTMVTVKVKGRSAVHAASGLQDFGHILEDGKSIYNTTLNKSDLSTGENRYDISYSSMSSSKSCYQLLLASSLCFC